MLVFFQINNYLKINEALIPCLFSFIIFLFFFQVIWILLIFDYLKFFLFSNKYNMKNYNLKNHDLKKLILELNPYRKKIFFQDPPLLWKYLIFFFRFFSNAGNLKFNLENLKNMYTYWSWYSQIYFNSLFNLNIFRFNFFFSNGETFEIIFEKFEKYFHI